MPLKQDDQGRQVVPIVVDNNEEPINSDRVFPVTNAASGEVVHYYAGADVATCDRACEAAWKAFQDWRKAPVGRRRELLLRVAQLYEERLDDLVQAQMKETSCQESWAKFNVLASTNCSIADKFNDLLIEQFKSTPGGMAVSNSIAQNAIDILKDAKDKGAKFLYGDGGDDGKCSIHPTIVLVDPKTSPEHLRIVDEETFGPSVSVYIIENDKQAIQLANRSAYGLNAAIHTQNLERAIKMGRELEYGQVHTNCSTVYISPTAPQGGMKGSGWGRQNASWGLDEYYSTKQISWHGKDSGN